MTLQLQFKNKEIHCVEEGPLDKPEVFLVSVCARDES
jgi:hypothetical protein